MNSSNNYLEKILDFHNGALLVMALAPSWGITKLFNIIFKGVENKELIMPLVVVAFGIFAFFILYAVDFILGISASRKNNIPITGDKLCKSFWKFFCVIILMLCLTIFCFLFIALNLNDLYKLFLYLTVAINIMICLYEFGSIGRNLETIYKEKPKYFTLFDNISKTIEKGITNKLQKLFKL
jgi:hypothetical protein